MFCSQNVRHSYLTFMSLSKNQTTIVKVLITLVFAGALGACQTYRFEDPWPGELPDRKLFIDGYLEKRDLKTATNAQLEYHLGWIKKFYRGTALYPHGWLSASEQYLATISSTSLRQEIDARLVKLGVIIGNEWAQDNNVRLINSANMASWAGAMRTAAERNQHSVFLDSVEKDVMSLLSGELAARDINYERYFNDETYDDF